MGIVAASGQRTRRRRSGQRVGPAGFALIVFTLVASMPLSSVGDVRTVPERGGERRVETLEELETRARVIEANIWKIQWELDRIRDLFHMRGYPEVRNRWPEDWQMYQDLRPELRSLRRRLAELYLEIEFYNQSPDPEKSRYPWEAPEDPMLKSFPFFPPPGSPPLERLPGTEPLVVPVEIPPFEPIPIDLPDFGAPPTEPAPSEDSWG